MASIGNMVPELINAYNVYLSGRLLGVSGEVELPELEALTETIEAAGVLGEIEAPATGHFGSTKTKIPFAILHEDVFKLVDTTKALELTLRGSEQFQDKRTGNTEDIPVKIVLRGKATTSTLGTLAKGKKGEPEIEIESFYIKVEVNGSVVLELDKLNFKFVVDGKDLMAKIRKNI